MFDIVSINRRERLAMTSTGEVCPIATFLDEFGDEVDDPSFGVVAIGPLSDGTWFSVDMRAFDATPQVH